jgi:hypothetical protein
LVVAAWLSIEADNSIIIKAIDTGASLFNTGASPYRDVTFDWFNSLTAVRQLSYKSGETAVLIISIFGASPSQRAIIAIFTIIAVTVAIVAVAVVKGHTGRGTRKAIGQHAVNILDEEKERRTMELQSCCEKSLHYWVHMVSTVSAYADTYISGIARNSRRHYCRCRRHRYYHCYHYCSNI